MRYSAGDASTMGSQTIIDAQEHPIETVMLYSKRAEVRRVISLELKTGRNEFSIINLPSRIVPDTFHVSGLSAGEATVVDTTCVVPKSKSSLETTKQKHIQEKHYQKKVELEIKKNQLLREQSLIHAKNDVLLSYARSLSDEHTQPEDFVSFLAQFNEAGEKSLVDTSRIEVALEEIDLHVRKLKLGESDEEDNEVDLANQQRTKAGVMISAKEDCSIKLVLTYVVSDAGWSPAYELHATTDSTTKAVANTVNLHYRAVVTQTTGEDWDDAHLTLSTAELSMNMAVPTLRRSTIQENRVQQYLFGNNKQKAPAAAPFGTQSLFGAAASVPTGGGLFGSTTAPTEPQQQSEPSPVLVPPEPELQPLDHGSAEAKDQVLASTYRVDTPVRVMSDNTPHRVAIMAVQLAAKTDYVTVPELTRSAYLQCKVKNTLSHQFPPGPLVTYLDGSYVEKSSIPLILPESEITRSLGTDPGIRVTFKRTTVTKKAQPAAVFARQTVTVVTDTITIKNTRSSVVPRVLVRHAIPTPGGDDRFQVTLKVPEGLAHLESGVAFKLRDRVSAQWTDDWNPTTASGLLRWSIDQLAAQGSEEIQMVYEVGAPEGVKWFQRQIGFGSS